MAHYEIECECAYRNAAADRDTAERYARKHEALEGHINRTVVTEVA